jgi:hypothetical protein
MVVPARVRGDPVDEGLVDLDEIDGKVGQVAERRVPGSEVIDREADAEASDGVKTGQGEVEILDDGTLGDLQDERPGRESRGVQRAGNVVDQVGFLELMRSRG